MESDQKRAFLAVVLSGIVLFGWQKFYGPGDQTIDLKNKPSVSNEATIDRVAQQGNDIANSTQNKTENNKNVDVEILHLTSGESTIVFDSKLNDIVLTNSGLNFNSNEILGSNDGQLLKIQVVDSSGNVVNKNPAKVVGLKPNFVSLVFSDSKIINVMVRENGLVNFSTTFPAKINVTFGSKEERLENGQVRLLKVLSESTDDYDLSDNEFFDAKTQWFGVDFNYHLVAFSFLKKANIAYKISNNSVDGDSVLNISTSSLENINFDLVFAKKNYDELIKIGNNLDKSVDFGILGLLAVPILRGLQFFYNVFPNYGVSIIILTILIRLITFPLQYKSFKSMKKMSLLQPEINKLKEKFKDDPQRLQKETMELFKRSGANPLGGCLPMLLQMPVFFAFYKVLYAAVELVGQPFYFWIGDLSEKDPYFVLPVILTVAMFFQQKLTPNTSTDPTQQKVMMFMPLIFGFIMKDMPAGLVLYICVSTVFQMVQQVFVNKAA